ncbi:MAG: hypothetical protein ACXIVO_13790 [Glycocaulis sp.]
MSRAFSCLSNLEREGARRIARALLRDGVGLEAARISMRDRRGVDMPMDVLKALAPQRPQGAEAFAVSSGASAPSVRATRPGGQSALQRASGALRGVEAGAVPARGLTAGFWSPEEDAALRRMHAAGATPADMASALNRSLYSVLARRGVLGLKTGNRRRWSDEDLEKLKTLRAQGMKRGEIAKALNRTLKAVVQQLHKLERAA